MCIRDRAEPENNDEIIEEPVSSEKTNGDEVITRVLEKFDGEILR